MTGRPPKILTALIAVSLSSFALAGCSGSSADDKAGSVSGKVDRSKELRFAIPFSPLSLDPVKGTSREPLWLRNVYDNLLGVVVGKGGTAAAGPGLATKFEFSNNGLDLAFTLRDDVKFQDGSTFTADAVKANIDRAKTLNGSTYGTAFAPIKDVQVTDATHVTFHLNQPAPALPWILASTTGGMIVNPKAFNSDLAKVPAGSGPYTLVPGSSNTKMVFKRWDGYWDEDKNPASSITISEVVDGNARYNGVRSGQYDAAWLAHPQDQQSLDLKDQGFQPQTVLGSAIYGLYFNTKVAPFDDVRVRKAVTMALNRPQIAKSLWPLSEAVDQVFAPGTLGYDKSLKTVPYDPEAAKKLIEEAGVAGKTVKFIATTTPPMQSVMEVVQQAVSDVGLKVQLIPLNASEATPTFLRGGYGAVLTTISTTPERAADLELNYLGGGRSPAPAPAELVKMAKAAAVLPLDSSEREAAYQGINRYLTTESVITVPMQQVPITVLAGPNVRGKLIKFDGYVGLNLLGVGIAE